MIEHAKTILRRVKRKLVGAKPPLVDSLQRFARPYSLHIGCGKVRLENWVNIDLEDTGCQDVIWDISRSIPCSDSSCIRIYNEHVLEHLAIGSAQHFLRECHRALRPNGVLRIAMPSLEAHVREYTDGTWKDQSWLKEFGYTWIRTRGEYLNICLREWGHQWVYDEEELERRLREAGFDTVRAVEWGKSTDPELGGRETRRESRLILEAVR